MVDNDAFRRYLEQQREMGETEIVFDSLRSSDLRALVGRSHHPDWRASLRKVGLEAEPAAPRPVSKPSTEHSEPNAAESEDVMMAKKGKVVDKPSKLFDGGIANLPTLEDVAEVIASCTRCPLYLTAKNPVPGTGDPNAKVVCVGEGPGESEDESGLPFVGRAGALLTKILEAVNLSREEVFITNVVKHRPPGNRNPQPDEVEACSPYLIRQLELIKPKVIIAFGNFAAQTLLNTKDGIGKLRGTVHTYHGTPLVVTYHPAALLRNPNWKRPTWDDVKLARRVLDNAQGA